jgi:hypothetical protein
MELGEFFILQGINQLIVLALALVILMLVRKLQGNPALTETDWLLLFGHRRNQVFSLRLWTRFLIMLMGVGVTGYYLGRYLGPLGIVWLLAGVMLAVLAILFLAPLWLR